MEYRAVDGSPRTKSAAGDAYENLVIQTLTLSRQTVHALTGQRYDAAAQQRYTAERIHRLLIAQQADSQCKMMPPDIRASFDGDVTRAISKFEQTAGAAVIKQVRDSAAAAYNNSAPPCDSNLRQFLQAMAAEARQISGPQ
jgi:hypothetical protein